MSHSLLSSEQALDDYFAALLDDEFEIAEKRSEPVVAELAPQPLLQPIAERSYYLAEEEEQELELPNLNDVERLLKQLEHSNPVAELQLEQVLEKNTEQIALKPQSTVSDFVEDEIQDWDIATLADAEPVAAYVAEPEFEALSIEQEQVEPVYSQPDLDFETQLRIEPEPQSEPEIHTELKTKADSPLIAWHSTERVQAFQVLYFEVNAVTFAVPLDELGGIHQVAELSHLIGRPKWYLGLQSSRESQIDVVDTARWVMADKLEDDTYKTHYQYIVMLGDSSWGLASSKLLGTETLDPEKVRWRTTAGKRPWLAGMVKEKMCALIHVEALIAMLKAGLDVKALDK